MRHKSYCRKENEGTQENTNLEKTSGTGLRTSFATIAHYIEFYKMVCASFVPCHHLWWG